MAGSIWFGLGGRFDGGIVPVGGSTLDLLESKIENGEPIAYLPSCDVPFMAWVPTVGGIEIREVYFGLMLHADGDMRVQYWDRDAVEVFSKGQVTALIRGNYRSKGA